MTGFAADRAGAAGRGSTAVRAGVSCLLVCLLLPAVAAATESGCESLTALTREDLETYPFDRDPDPWENLPRGASYRLGTITVVRQDVFERERNWLHRLANRYHVTTREQVVRSVLPVSGGDVVGERQLAEAERILRSKVYFYDARVIPRRLCGRTLDVYVVTRDVWTLEPRFSLQRSGGENDVGVGLGDTNLIGTGKSVFIGFQRDEDRRGINVFASDPNIGDSRWSGQVLVVDNDDGERLAGSLARPFFSLDSRRALFFSADHFSRDEGLYYLSDEVWEYEAETRSARFAAGWSTGRRGREAGLVNRILLGYGYEDYEFRFPSAFEAAFPDIPAPDRKYAYPFVAFERIEEDYQTRVNLDRVLRTEDVALGRRMYLELGFAGASGPAGEHLVGRARMSDGLWLTDRQLLTWSARAAGYYDLDAGASENLVAELLASYRLRHTPKWSLLVHGSVTAARNQTLDEQLLAGGETGLRGYPNRYQPGDRRWLLTVEERYYADVYPLRMFRLGGAVFLDAGRAWYHDDAPAWLPGGRDAAYFGVLADVGVGLRLESTRTRGDRILHLDVAFPLREGPEVRGTEVTLTAKRTL